MTTATRLDFLPILRGPQRTKRKTACGETDSWTRLSRNCGEIGLIAAIVLAMGGLATAEVLEVRSGGTVLGLIIEPTEAVKVGAFRAADGSEAVIAVNATDTIQQTTLRWDGKSKRIELMPSEVKLLPR